MKLILIALITSIVVILFVLFLNLASKEERETIVKNNDKRQENENK